MFRLIREFLWYYKFTTNVKRLQKLTDVERVHLAMRPQEMEDKLDDACKIALFQDFRKKGLNADFVNGFMSALATRRRYSVMPGKTAPDSVKQKLAEAFGFDTSDAE